MRENKEHSIGLIGQGLIYQHVRRHVESRYQIIPFTTENSPQQLTTCNIIVYCSDIWSPRILQQINRNCMQAHVALLPVSTLFDEGLIGPCVVPQRKGCTSCAEFRKLEATPSEFDRELLRRCLSQACEGVSQSLLSSFGMEILAVLVEEEIATYLERPNQIRTGCALLSLSLETLECHRHSFLPFPACPDCGELTKDRAELAVITLQSQLKPDAFTYRIKQPIANAEQVLTTYVDQRIGLVSSLTVEHTNLLPIASSQLFSESETTAGTGSTFSPQQSKLVSVLEALERYAGLRPRSKQTIVRASYHQLIQQAENVLDPTTLGVHSEERYSQLKNSSSRHMVRYHHDLVCHWVWGYSFQNQSPILVPEHCAYYGVPATEENPLFVFDASNGCALGNCLEEAIFHGILEVVERDAFLLTWYAQLKLPRLDLCSVTNPAIRLLINHLEYHSGYTIYAWNATLDHVIPCLWLLGVDEQNREGKPKVYVAAGAHPHPEQALLKALREFAMYLAFPCQLDQQTRTQALKMLADSSLVRKMDHHPLVYYLSEAFERLHFLYHTPRQQTFQEAFHGFYYDQPKCMDLRDDLEHLIKYYLKHGMDIIVVDQTAPEHLACGLRCFKVLIPGMLPMTFGHHNRRIIGFDRLRHLPFTLGYQDHPLTDAEINSHPHPFF
jgi:ribosomal protein S12 methylthiotransferase accessory factor